MGPNIGWFTTSRAPIWMHRRVKRAQFQRLKAQIEEAGDREDVDVALTLDRLFADVSGLLAHVRALECGLRWAADFLARKRR